MNHTAEGTTRPGGRSPKADYQSERRKRGMTLVFPSMEVKDHYVRLAGPMDLQSFILTQLAAATNGTVVPPEVLAQKDETIARLTRWYETAREEVAELRRQLEVVTREKEDYRVLLAQEGRVVTLGQALALEGERA